MKLDTIFAFTLVYILLVTATEFPSTVAGDDVGSVISASLFEQLLKHRNDQACEGKGFYRYNAFVTAARSFDAFGTTGDVNTRKREVAAFLAQSSHETTGKSYYGRGPLQLTHNYNYDLAGKALKLDLINNPDWVAQDPVVSFKAAIWFWMTPQANKPSCHDVITNKWTPSSADVAANRTPGYGVITTSSMVGLNVGVVLLQAQLTGSGFIKGIVKFLGSLVVPTWIAVTEDPLVNKLIQ